MAPKIPNPKVVKVVSKPLKVVVPNSKTVAMVSYRLLLLLLLLLFVVVVVVVIVIVVTIIYQSTALHSIGHNRC